MNDKERVKEAVHFIMDRFAADDTWFRFLKYTENNPDWVKKAGRIKKSTDARYNKMSVKTWEESIRQDERLRIDSELAEIYKKYQKLEAENAELQKYKRFYNHIKAHFEKEHPDWEVKCKICNMTFREILNLESGGEVPLGNRLPVR